MRRRRWSEPRCSSARLPWLPAFRRCNASLWRLAPHLQWLANADVFPKENGKPADDMIRNTVWRMESTPGQWALTTSRKRTPFAQPIGAQRWQAAFEALKRDATTPLPED